VYRCDILSELTDTNMAGGIQNNGDGARPLRKVKPTATLLEHSEAAALPSHKKRIDDFRKAERLAAAIPAATNVPPFTQPQPTSTHGSSSPGPSSPLSDRSPSIEIDSDMDGKCEHSQIAPKTGGESFGCQSVAIINHGTLSPKTPCVCNNK
jgi:hypothetical protein